MSDLELKIKNRQSRIGEQLAKTLGEYDALVKLCEQDHRPGQAQKYANDREALRQVYVRHF